MPRPQKTNVTWFPHPVAHGRKMGLLERKYGNDGYAVWFKVLEELGGAENHCILLTADTQIELYAYRCLVTEERFMLILSDLIRWEEFDSEIWETRRALFSLKFIESVREFYRKRKTNPPSRSDILAKLPIIGKISQPQPVTGHQPPVTGHPPLSAISSYEDLMRLPVIEAAKALTGDPSDYALNTWRKYLRILSSEDPERGERMFREILAQLHGEIKAGEIRSPAAMLTKRLKEIAS